MTLFDVVNSSTKLRPSARRTYAAAVGSFERFAVGQPLNGALVERWRDSRLASGVSPATVAKELAAVKFASRRATALGVIAVDVAAGAEFPSRPPWAPRVALGVDELLAIEDACRRDQTPVGLRDLALIRTAARGTGARRAEMEQLTIGSFRDPILTIERKGGWSQTLTIDSPTAVAISEWLSWRRGRGSEPMFVSLRRSTSDEWVRGRSLSGAGIAHVVSRRAREAGIRRRIGPHLLRHTFFSMALAAGVPPHRVMVAGGHKSLTTTSRYVSDVTPDASPVGAQIADLLGSGQ
jgi:integrase